MNKLKEMIQKQEKPLGVFIETCSSYVVECIRERIDRIKAEQ